MYICTLSLMIGRHHAKNETNNIEDMKTFFLTLTFALTTIFTFAQTSEHLSFKVEKFDSYSQPKDDNARMYEVRFDRCKY